MSGELLESRAEDRLLLSRRELGKPGSDHAVATGSGRRERGQLDGIPQALAYGEIRDVW